MSGAAAQFVAGESKETLGRLKKLLGLLPRDFERRITVLSILFETLNKALEQLHDFLNNLERSSQERLTADIKRLVDQITQEMEAPQLNKQSGKTSLTTIFLPYDQEQINDFQADSHSNNTFIDNELINFVPDSEELQKFLSQSDTLLNLGENLKIAKQIIFDPSKKLPSFGSLFGYMNLAVLDAYTQWADIHLDTIRHTRAQFNIDEHPKETFVSEQSEWYDGMNIAQTRIKSSYDNDTEMLLHRKPPQISISMLQERSKQNSLSEQERISNNIPLSQLFTQLIDDDDEFQQTKKRKRINEKQDYQQSSIKRDKFGIIRKGKESLKEKINNNKKKKQINKQNHYDDYDNEMLIDQYAQLQGNGISNEQFRENYIMRIRNENNDKERDRQDLDSEQIQAQDQMNQFAQMNEKTNENITQKRKLLENENESIETSDDIQSSKEGSNIKGSSYSLNELIQQYDIYSDNKVIQDHESNHSNDNQNRSKSERRKRKKENNSQNQQQTPTLTPTQTPTFVLSDIEREKEKEKDDILSIREGIIRKEEIQQIALNLPAPPQTRSISQSPQLNLQNIQDNIHNSTSSQSHNQRNDKSQLNISNNAQYSPQVYSSNILPMNTTEQTSSQSMFGSQTKIDRVMNPPTPTSQSSQSLSPFNVNNSQSSETTKKTRTPTPNPPKFGKPQTIQSNTSNTNQGSNINNSQLFQNIPGQNQQFNMSISANTTPKLQIIEAPKPNEIKKRNEDISMSANPGQNVWLNTQIQQSQQQLALQQKMPVSNPWPAETQITQMSDISQNQNQIRSIQQNQFPPGFIQKNGTEQTSQQLKFIQSQQNNQISQTQIQAQPKATNVLNSSVSQYAAYASSIAQPNTNKGDTSKSQKQNDSGDNKRSDSNNRSGNANMLNGSKRTSIKTSNGDISSSKITDKYGKSSKGNANGTDNEKENSRSKSTTSKNSKKKSEKKFKDDEDGIITQRTERPGIRSGSKSKDNEIDSDYEDEIPQSENEGRESNGDNNSGENSDGWEVAGKEKQEIKPVQKDGVVQASGVVGSTTASVSAERTQNPYPISVVSITNVQGQQLVPSNRQLNGQPVLAKYGRDNPPPQNMRFEGILLGNFSPETRRAWVACPVFPDNVFLDLRRVRQEQQQNIIMGAYCEFTVEVNVPNSSDFRVNQIRLSDQRGGAKNITKATKGICIFYTRQNWCKHGDKCNYAHITLAKEGFIPTKVDPYWNDQK